ncbi:uncharacterized protein LOC62_04G006283 [Vanrija pseudolonga]|uniref:Uncharacterized protein n=1 Tax=Vanrija pseudolonga TaxID=143232 RepID=A0AAF1BJI7_9TREE|nr:hypothetical protein LOC62_04G006283 [Vanrija pseudolonga]
MTARIPQLYAPRPPAAASRPVPPPTDVPEPVNPFASTEALVAPRSNAAPSAGGGGLAPPVTDAELNRNSANLSSIGDLFMGGDSDDEETMAPPKKAAGRARSNTIETKYATVDRAALHARVRSLEGSVEDGGSDYDADDKSTTISSGARISFNGSSHARALVQPMRNKSILRKAGEEREPQQQRNQVQFSGQSTPPPQQQRQLQQQAPSPQQQQQQQQQQFQQPSPQSYPANNLPAGPPRQPVVINFPTPNIASPPTPTTPTRGGGSPQPQLHAPRPERPTVNVHMQTPISHPPISPMLAAPPRAVISPLTPPASPGIQAFDQLREKHAAFREGEDEVFTPFSPRARQAGPRVRAPQAKSGLAARMSRPFTMGPVDFWKRFSTAGHLARHDKESQWISDHKRSIFRNPYFTFPLILSLLAVGAVITFVIIKLHNQPSLGQGPVPAPSAATS